MKGSKFYLLPFSFIALEDILHSVFENTINSNLELIFKNLYNYKKGGRYDNVKRRFAWKCNE